MNKEYVKPKLELFRDATTIGVRDRQLGGRAVLLSGRPEGLPRPGLLPGTEGEVQGAGRLRRGIRGRPRGRASRSKPAGHQRQGPRGCKAGPSKAEANELSVRLELQADFLAGVWAHHTQKTKHILEVGDVESGLRAATAIGDDRLQMEAQGYVVPDSFTHGTSNSASDGSPEGSRPATSIRVILSTPTNCKPLSDMVNLGRSSLFS